MVLKSRFLSSIEDVKNSLILSQNEQIDLILNLQKKIEDVNCDIEGMISEQNAKKIKEHYSNLTEFGSFNINKMWNLKKKILPPKNDQISAKKDSTGNMVSDKKSLSRIYKDEYIKRLTPTPPYAGYEDIQILKKSII